MTQPNQRPRPPRHPLPAALTDHAGYLAVRLGQRAQRRFEEAVVTLELRPAQYDYLTVLAEFGPVAQRDLAGILGIDAARIVVLTDEMERRGVVERRVDPSDRRRNLLTVTPAGRGLLTRARGLATRVESDLLASLSADERVTLRRLLRQALGLA